MPQEPKKKHSKARKRTRRASIKLGISSLVKCTQCGQMRIPHQTCKNCGYYNGQEVSSKKSVKVIKA